MPNKNEENKNQAVQNEQEPQGSNIWEDASNLDKIEEADEIEEAEKPLSYVQHWADDQEQKIYNVYGSTVKHPLVNAQKDALEAIEITPPEELGDLGEAFISMVTMGASMNPDYVKDLETSSTIPFGTTAGEFNQSNVSSNIPKGDNRFLTKGFADALLRGRIDAAEAIEQYKQGNYEPVKEALRRFLRAVGNTVPTMGSHGLSREINTVQYGNMAMADKLLSAQLPFPVEELLPAGELAKLKSGLLSHKIHANTIAQADELEKNPGAPGSPERDALLSRVALGLNMTRLYDTREIDAFDQGDAFTQQLLLENGIEPGTEEFQAMTTGQFDLSGKVGVLLHQNMMHNELTELEYIYSQPGAEQWAERNFLAQIKNTPAYQEALNESDPARMKARLDAISRETRRNKGLEAFITPEHYAPTAQQHAQASATFQEAHNAGLEEARKFVRDAIAEYRQVKEVRETLENTILALGDRPGAAALRQSLQELHQTLRSGNQSILSRTACQDKMREVTRLAAAYTRSVREKAKAKGEEWAPKNASDRAAYYAAAGLEGVLAPHIQPQPQAAQRPAYHVPWQAGMSPEERREIERSMELFAAIPETNTDRAVDELLRREEQYRAAHAMDQDLLMASGVRTMMLLAAQQRFAPGQNETAAETARRQRAMKEALSPERVLNNMMAICVVMARGAISPIEGVTVVDGYDAIRAAFIDREDGSYATTEDIRRSMRGKTVQLELFDNSGQEKLAFYEGSTAFEESFLNEGQPLPPEHVQAYAKVQEAFRSLNDTLTPFYERNEKGELPTLTEEDFNKIRDGYQNVLAEMNAYSTQLGQSGHPLDMHRMELMASFRDRMGQDLVTLEAGRQLGLSTLPNLMLGGDLPTAEIEGVPEIFGDLANSRMRVSLPGNGGEVEEGFFTATSAVETDIPGLFNRVLDQHMGDRPEWKEFVTKLYQHDQGGNLSSISMLNSFENDMAQTVDQSGFFDAWVGDEDPQFKALYQRCRSHELSLAILKFAKDYAAQLGIVKEYNAQGLSSGNLDKRNSAMSTMAEMMKRSGLVAPARSVKVKVGGKELVGTFMKFAEGEDLSQVQQDSPLTKVNVEDMLTPESVSSVADLQVLDYVCGNVDRHQKNMFYKLDTTDPQHPKCVGVQGIDNDFSFCAHAEGKSMADIVNMKIIRKETADTLFSMKPEMIKTVLSKYDLSQTETFAVLKRIGELKQAVENGTLKVVTDEQIKTMNYQTELLSGGDNYFGRLMRIPQAARRQAFQSDGAAMDKAYRGLNANTPALGRCYDGLVAANQGKFIGSKEYKAVLNGLQDLIAHRSELLNDRDPESVALYERRLSELRVAVIRYLSKKAKEARHSKPSKLAERRVAAVRAFSAKLGLEEAHIHDYREAETARERYLNGMTQQEEYRARSDRDNLEIDRYFAKGAARDLFPRLADRKDPLLARCGAELKKDADVVFAKAGEPDTPEIMERKVRLYAGLVANRMIEQQLEKGGESAQKLKAAWEQNHNLFEQMRERVMNSPVFVKDHAHDIDSTLTADTSQFDNMIIRIERAEAQAREQNAQAKANAPEIAENAPQKNNEQLAQNNPKKSGAPKI